MEPQQQKPAPAPFDPNAFIKRAATVVFGSPTGIIIAAILLCAAGTTVPDNLLRWVLFAGIGPLLIWSLILRRSPAEIGFRRPTGTTWRRDLLIVIAITIPVMAGISCIHQFQVYYAAHYTTFVSALWALIGQTAIYFFFEELLFHGFMFFALLQKIGKIWSTVWVSLVFTIMHLGKPWPELIIAAAYSVIFCWLSARSKSFFSAAIVHFTLSLVVNLMVVYVWVSPLGAMIR